MSTFSRGVLSCLLLLGIVCHWTSPAQAGEGVCDQVLNLYGYQIPVGDNCPPCRCANIAGDYIHHITFDEYTCQQAAHFCEDPQADCESGDYLNWWHILCDTRYCGCSQYYDFYSVTMCQVCPEDVP